MKYGRGDIRVELAYLEEGRHGWYDPDDPDDMQLLRMWASRRSGGVWVDVADASVLTMLPASLSVDEQRLAVQLCYRGIQRALIAGHDLAETFVDLATRLTSDGAGGIYLSAAGELEPPGTGSSEAGVTDFETAPAT